MASDITRFSDEQGYQGVVMQQGRVILDRDFNALGEIVDRRIDADALDFVGPCGTPDDGFKIGLQVSSSSPPLWSPPSPLSPPGSKAYDFSISAGTMYVGGQRAEFPAFVSGQGAVEYSYFDQMDWISPGPPSARVRQEFIYLHLMDQAVSAVEDPELRDVALGGPDTTQRVRLIKRVKRMATDSTDCTAARAYAAGRWQQQGLAFDPQTMRLVPQATLLVSFPTTASQPNPCDPVAQGGYLGAENQLIRVQITDGGKPGATPQLLWGCDNASSLYRATVSSQLSTSSSTTLALGQSPVDAFHVPQQGQVVEVLRSALVIDSELDETNPQQPGTIIRCVAEAGGIICTLTAPYQAPTRTLSLNRALPPEYLADTTPLFVRVWQSQIPFTPDGSTPYLLNYANGNSTGVQVTIGVPSTGGTLQSPPIGAYWMIAVRPSTPQAVYPERFLSSPQPPDGPRQWVCPLGTIEWLLQSDQSFNKNGPQAVFHDCRNTFNNLVDLSKRNLGGCCAVTLHPQDLATNPAALQNAANQFGCAAQGAAICLMPGTYSLSQTLQLNSSHRGLTIEACHGAVTLQAAANADLTQFLQGLVVLAGTDSITLKGITFVPPAVDLSAAMPVPSGGVANNLQAALAAFTDPHMLIGLRLLDCTNLTVLGCEFQFSPTSGVGNFGAGLFATGNCTGLSVKQCLFVGPTRAVTLTEVAVLVESQTQTVAPSTGASAARAAAPGAVAGAAKKPEEAKKPAGAATAAATGTSSAISEIASDQRNSLLNVAQKLAATPGLFNIKEPVQQPTNPVVLPPPPPVMVAAFLMAPCIDPTFNYTNPLTLIGGTSGNEAALLAQAVLDQAEFVDNRMQGLSVAMLASAVSGAVTIRDNTITDCIGGIWFATLSQDNVLDAGVFQAALGFNVQQGLNAGIAMALTMWYPLPQPSSSIKNLQTLSPRFQVVSNLIDAIPLDGSFSGPACMLSLSAPPTPATSPGAAPAAAPADVNTSILLNSNQVRNSTDSTITQRSPTWLFGATVFLFDASNTIVGSNLVRNMATPATTDDSGNILSLIVFPAASGQTAVSGNLTVGVSYVAP